MNLALQTLQPNISIPICLDPGRPPKSLNLQPILNMDDSWPFLFLDITLIRTILFLGTRLLNFLSPNQSTFWTPLPLGPMAQLIHLMKLYEVKKFKTHPVAGCPAPNENSIWPGPCCFSVFDLLHSETKSTLFIDFQKNFIFTFHVLFL